LVAAAPVKVLVAEVVALVAGGTTTEDGTAAEVVAGGAAEVVAGAAAEEVVAGVVPEAVAGGAAAEEVDGVVGALLEADARRSGQIFGSSARVVEISAEVHVERTHGVALEVIRAWLADVQIQA